MSEKKNIAIIGCGIFGATVSLRLNELGYNVTVFEKNKEILTGASLNNQNRLHLGFHYPRDMETARQCIKGFERFVRKFPECISARFPNAYYIAENHSHTTPNDYLSFCDRLGVGFEKITPDNFSVDVNNTSLGLLCDELVYDSNILKQTIVEKMAQSEISLKTKSDVDSVKQLSNCYRVTLGSGESDVFDAVVNCSYADINRITSQLGFGLEERQYEYTAVPIISVEGLPKVGITIMDGGFMTILPFGKSDKFLMYHVKHTVVATETKKLMDTNWLVPNKSPFAKIDKNNFFETMLIACKKYVPALEGAKLEGFLQGPRMVLAKKDDTDARPSMINSYASNYHTVFSGKIDHCVWVADDVAARISDSFAH
jgi:hypothetical protein